MIILHEGIGQGGLLNQIGDYFATFTGFGQGLNYLTFIYILYFQCSMCKVCIVFAFTKARDGFIYDAMGGWQILNIYLS